KRAAGSQKLHFPACNTPAPPPIQESEAMTKPIVQKVTFKAPAPALYRLYVDAKAHSQATGAKALISPKPGSRFSAFDGELWGVTLLALKNKMIVQRWRSSSFKMSDADSILTLVFSNQADLGVVELCHVNVPDHDHAGVTQGWRDYYWTP